MAKVLGIDLVIANSVMVFQKTDKGRILLRKAHGLIDRIKIGLGMALLVAALTGCVGYVGGGYRGGVVVPGPGVYVWGGDYDRGRDVPVYSQRGAASRAVAHPAAGRHGGKG